MTPRTATLALRVGLLAPVAGLDEKAKSAHAARDAAFDRGDAKGVAPFYAADYAA